MQNVGGGHLVHDFAAPLTARVRLKQRAGDSGCRESLIPEGDGERAERGEIAHEGPGRLHARPFGIVHVDGEPDDQTADIMAGDDREQLLDIRLELDAANGFERRGDRERDVAKSKADRFGAEVESEQTLAGCEPGAQIGDVGYQSWGRRFFDRGLGNRIAQGASGRLN